MSRQEYTSAGSPEIVEVFDVATIGESPDSIGSPESAQDRSRRKFLKLGAAGLAAGAGIWLDRKLTGKDNQITILQGRLNSLHDRVDSLQKNNESLRYSNQEIAAAAIANGYTYNLNESGSRGIPLAVARGTLVLDATANPPRVRNPIILVTDRGLVYSDPNLVTDFAEHGGWYAHGMRKHGHFQLVPDHFDPRTQQLVPNAPETTPQLYPNAYAHLTAGVIPELVMYDYATKNQWESPNDQAEVAGLVIAG